MSRNTVIEVVLRLRDQMGGPARKALDSLAQAARGAGQGAGAAARALGDVGRAASALKSDRVREMTRHVARTRQEARSASRELDSAAKSGERLASALSRVGRAGSAAWGGVRNAGQAGTGLAAGAGVAAAALRKPIEFEKRMTLMANTAFSDEKDTAKRLAGRKQLVDSVNAAVRAGGGTRDEAADALEKMLASGAVKSDTAQKLLPTIQKFATASGAASGDIADIVIQGLRSKFFTEDQATLALDKAMASGQAGGFDLKDMAKWLPKMLAMGSGMKSMAGFEQILAYSQAAATTAGSKDEAGNNLVNLLQKLNSEDTAKDFKDRTGIDLTGSLIKAREKGVLPLEAFGDLLEQRVMGKDKRYQDLKKRLGSAQGDEKKQILGDMADLASASAVGKVIQDRQALLALIAAINQKDLIQKNLEAMRNASGEGDRSFETYKGSTAYSVERAANEAEIARSGMLSDTSGPLKAVADTAADLAQKFPQLATVAMEAATAIAAMTAAAAAFGALRMFGGAGGAAAAAGAGTAAKAGWFASALKSGKSWLDKLAGPALTAGLFAAQTVGVESNDALTRAQKNVAHAQNTGGLAGTLAGAKLGAMGGAALGSAVPVIGTAVGGVAGGVLGGAAGWFMGTDFGRWVGNKLWGPSQESAEAAKSLAAPREQVIKNEVTVTIDGREIARAVNEYNAHEAARD